MANLPAVRVIAGSLKGRRLRAPTGSGTRPTADRVREAVFDVLGSLVELEGLAVLDLFAGSGAMGIEALSRGADSAVFVERSPDALRTLRANLAALGLGDRAQVVHSEVLGWLARPRHADLVLCDPPYAFDAWAQLLAALPGTWAVLESDRPLELSGHWRLSKEKRYGGTLVTVARRGGGPATDEKGVM